MSIVDIAEALKSKDKVAIASHIMPDGDNIGSMLALYNALKGMGKDAVCYSSDVWPDIYSFLPRYGDVKICTDDPGKEYDIFAVLDCGSTDRTGKCSSLKDHCGQVINIDHHATNSNFGDLNLVETSASSTGELIYHVLKEMGVSISRDIACCLYTAILTDTGCFKYSNTTEETHRIAGELISTGIDFGEIHSEIYNNYNYKDLKFMGKAIESIELYGSGKIAYMQLDKDSMDGVKIGDINTTDFINYARDIKGVEVAAFVKAGEPGEFRVSFRSKKIVDVREVCEKFGGGGHIRAAGCTIRGTLSDVKNTVLRQLENALKGENTWMEY